MQDIWGVSASERFREERVGQFRKPLDHDLWLPSTQGQRQEEGSACSSQPAGQCGASAPRMCTVSRWGRNGQPTTSTGLHHWLGVTEETVVLAQTLLQILQLKADSLLHCSPNILSGRGSVQCTHGCYKGHSSIIS